MSGETVGFIGLGAMGMGMAKRLVAAGFDVAGTDVRGEAVAALATAGGRGAASPAEAASGAAVLFVMVVNAAQAEAVLFGENGAVGALPRGSAVVLNSTVPASAAAALADRLAETGYPMLDAPVSGGTVGAEGGTLTVMASGPDDAFAKAGPALDAVAKKVYRLGDKPGIGSTVKTVNQLLAGVHIAAAAEAMALGIRAGMAPKDIYEVITHSAGNSWMFENRMAHVLAGDYTPLSAVDIFVKDLGIVLDTARGSRFPLPLASTAHQMFMQASSSGHGGEDDAAVIKIFPGIELPGQKS
jgi:L-threonate 2-dehydrogenase